jgi:N-acetylneuraminic acid mutarotase
MKLLAAAVSAIALVVPAGWETRAPLPLPRAEVAATVLKGEIVLAGGFLADGSTSSAVSAYAPGSDRWRSLPDLPVAVNHAMAAAAAGRLYVLGGYAADGSVQRSAWVLDAGRWRALPSLPIGRAAAGAAVVGGKLYVAGGVAATPAGGRALAKAMLVFDLDRRRWSAVNGPTPREHLAVTSASGTLFVLGGRLGGIDSNLGLLESYRAGRGWRRLPPVPYPRGGTGAAAIGGRIVSAGGEEPAGTIGSVYAYDIARARWSRLPDLPTPRHGLGVAAVGGRVYVIGGGTVPGLSVSSANEVLDLG